MTKAEQIKNTLQEVRKRRQAQKPVVYELKLQNLSKRKSEVLRKAFLEAKWLYNWLVSGAERLEIPANRVSVVEIKVGDSFETRELTVLGSQIKQEIADRIKDNLKLSWQRYRDRLWCQFKTDAVKRHQDRLRNP
ncbi:hypothetical protein [Thermotoga sp.]|uniref:hypothetical protein n=1 Tax=Thermotoga sp. TaxID=28240 RepID=UPI0025DB2D33|nr:hypothetical protein [Thermotoga sp.]MCD6550937.1 hypothetical protein [Thermotoga sp.]